MLPVDKFQSCKGKSLFRKPGPDFLEFFEYKTEMIHGFIFKTNLVGTYFEYGYLVTEFFVKKKPGDKGSIQKVFS